MNTNVGYASIYAYLTWLDTGFVTLEDANKALSNE